MESQTRSRNIINPDGLWVLGKGDSSPEIRRIRAFLRRKFASYAGHLADIELFDQELVDVVMELQSRYGVTVTGWIGYSDKVRMGYIQVTPPAKSTLYTVCGTGVPWWIGPDADIGRRHWRRIVSLPVRKTGNPSDGGIMRRSPYRIVDLIRQIDFADFAKLACQARGLHAIHRQRRHGLIGEFDAP